MHQRASALVLSLYLYLNMHEASVFVGNHLFSHCFATAQFALLYIGTIHQLGSVEGAGRMYMYIGELFIVGTSAAGVQRSRACLHFHMSIDLISKVKC